jgi:hypothetical protein
MPNRALLFLLALTVPATGLAAAKKKTAKSAHAQTLSQDELVAGCMAVREKAWQCKDPFIDAMMALRDRHAAPSIPKDQWAAAREQGLRELEADGSGPVEPRQKRCADAVAAGMMSSLSQKDGDDMNACLAKTSCADRVPCMIGVLERTMFSR